MTKAKWGDGFTYENSKGEHFAVKNETDLDARLVQDIMLCNIRREVVETEEWLLRFVERSDPAFRDDIEAALERLRNYLKPDSNHIEVMWEHNVIPTNVVERVMNFLAREEVYVKPPVFIAYAK